MRTARGALARTALSLLSAAALAAAGLLAIGPSAAAAAADADLVRNGGFEAGLDGWTCSAGSGAVVSTPVHGGSSALKGTPAGQDNARCSQTVTVKPDSAYTLSAWVQGAYVYLGATGTGTTDDDVPLSGLTPLRYRCAFRNRQPVSPVALGIPTRLTCASDVQSVALTAAPNWGLPIDDHAQKRSAPSHASQCAAIFRCANLAMRSAVAMSNGSDLAATTRGPISRDTNRRTLITAITARPQS